MSDFRKGWIMSKEQNIYDNDVFFKGYKNIRMNKNNYNELLEKPEMRAELPDLNNKSVLDLGCGYGENCKYFIDNGASKVVGIDISKNMLEVARNENSDSKIKFVNMDMNDISSIDDKFDVIYSSMAFHYISDFKHLISSVNRLLSKNGILVFSQEHPLTTSNKDDNRWTMEGKDYKHYNLTYYLDPGKRETTWIVENVIKYHRPFSEIINGLIDTGFVIQSVKEPRPSVDDIKLVPKMIKDVHKPNFLIVKAKKEDEF
jgi:SAM-dependent methyltransferase